jgi:hypothetical protein
MNLPAVPMLMLVKNLYRDFTALTLRSNSGNGINRLPGILVVILTESPFHECSFPVNE